ncbi:MAG: hypothetical protein BWY31_03927 [Lentisphaerae bacterium ADurb.Bin242]|nr:MAG: hypothetical protein BWY31_03927 [Lentisphaerae bacterium ADurb.Bin242]
MKKLLGMMILGFTASSFAGELVIEKDSIHYSRLAKFALLPYHYGMISVQGNQFTGSAIYFSMETKHPKKFFSMMAKEVDPKMVRKNDTLWEATAKIPADEKNIIDLTTTVHVTQFNSIEVKHSWKTAVPENIRAKGIFINYALKDFAKPCVKIDGKEYSLPNENQVGPLALNIDSPDLVLYPDCSGREFTITFDGKCNIYYYANKDKNSCLRVNLLDDANEFRYTILPK